MAEAQSAVYHHYTVHPEGHKFDNYHEKKINVLFAAIR
jgi:hypothetical protein